MSPPPRAPAGDGPVIIVGAGPAGLTAAYELGRLRRPAMVFERDDTVGGLSRTVSCDGYRFDIGGHRFYTKIAEIHELWLELLGEQLVERPRMSRIYYKGKYFDYPLRPLNAMRGLGPAEAIRIILSYLRAQLGAKAPERSFEDWVVRRFGRRLFEIFFKSYTEKVWGIACSEISADWAEQRIKNLDLVAALRNALLGHGTNRGEVVSTLIDRFHYPTHGPGMMWERCRDRADDLGVRTLTGTEVVQIRHRAGRVIAVEVRRDGQVASVATSHVISCMPIPALLRSLDPPPPPAVLSAAGRLRFRDFIIVVLIIEREHVFPDNWIYIHSPGVKVGRVQNYKNWSPCMVPDLKRTSLGLEYFVQEGDELWEASDGTLRELAVTELGALGLVDADEVVGATVLRVPKAYPVYDRGYHQALQTIRAYLSGIDGLQLVGRNGQHRYNNQDHSMLTGMLAARNVAGGRHDLWAANTDSSYLEEGAPAREAAPSDRAVPARIPEISFEEMLASVFARYDPVALGCSVSVVSGATVFLITALLLLRGGDPVGPTLSLLGNYLLGYQASWPAAVLSLLETSLGGFLFGYGLARLINLVVDLVATSILKECQLEGLLDEPDSRGASGR